MLTPLPLMRLGLAPLFICGIAAAGPKTLEIPSVTTLTGDPQLWAQHHLRANRCGVLLTHVGKLLRACNDFGHSRKGLSLSFRKELIEVGKALSERSDYFSIFRGDRSTRQGQIVGTIGISTANYADPTDDSERLGVELILKSVRLPRPSLPGGGIIFELRTYWKDKFLGKNALPLLWNGVYSVVFRHLQDFDPAIYDQEIIYAYADPASLKLYGPQGLGFRIMEEIPPEWHDDRPWQVIVTTPRNLERIGIENNWGERLIFVNQATDLDLPGGLKARSQPQTHLLIGADRRRGYATIVEETYLGHGVWVSAGSSFSWNQNDGREQYYVPSIAKPLSVPWLRDPLPIGMGVYLVDGNLKIASSNSEVSFPELGLALQPRGAIRLLEMDTTSATFETGPLSHDIRLKNGAHAKQGDSVVWKKDFRTQTLIPLRVESRK